MGIRIEDSVCVGEEAPHVLSVEAAKEVSVSGLWRGRDLVLTVIRSSISRLLVRVTPNRVYFLGGQFLVWAVNSPIFPLCILIRYPGDLGFGKSWFLKNPNERHKLWTLGVHQIYLLAFSPLGAIRHQYRVE